MPLPRQGRITTSHADPTCRHPAPKGTASQRHPCESGDHPTGNVHREPAMPLSPIPLGTSAGCTLRHVKRPGAVRGVDDRRLLGLPTVVDPITRRRERAFAVRTGSKCASTSAPTAQCVSVVAALRRAQKSGSCARDTLLCTDRNVEPGRVGTDPSPLQRRASASKSRLAHVLTCMTVSPVPERHTGRHHAQLTKHVNNRTGHRPGHLSLNRRVVDVLSCFSSSHMTSKSQMRSWPNILVLRSPLHFLCFLSAQSGNACARR